MKKFDWKDVIENGEYLGDTWYGAPYQSRRSRYYKYNDKFYEFTDGMDENGGWKEVDGFIMTHPRSGYEQYSEYRASTKKKVKKMKKELANEMHTGHVERPYESDAKFSDGEGEQIHAKTPFEFYNARHDRGRTEFSQYPDEERKQIFDAMRNKIRSEYDESSYDVAREDMSEYLEGYRNGYYGVPVDLDDREDIATMYALSYDDRYWDLDKYVSKSKFNVRKTKGSITGMELVYGELKVELIDDDRILDTVSIDLGDLPHLVVKEMMDVLRRNIEEIPSVLRYAEKYFNDYYGYSASTKKSKVRKVYPYTSDDLYEKLMNYVDWANDCEMMERIYDNDYAHYQALMNALTDALHYLETEEYKDAQDCLFAYNGILDEINSDWDIEQLNPDTISEIILALGGLMKSTKKSKSKKMKKSHGSYGVIEQMHDMSENERRLYDYKVNLDLDGFNGALYIWWRIFERDGIFGIRRLEGNSAEGLENDLRERYFGTLDEAIDYADMWTDRVKQSMLSLFGHGMDASWTDDDIDNYHKLTSTKKSKKMKKSETYDIEGAKCNFHVYYSAKDGGYVIDAEGTSEDGNLYHIPRGGVYDTLDEAKEWAEKYARDDGISLSAKKSKVNKSTIDFHEGMTLREFFEKNHNPNRESIMGFDLYSVDLNGRQVATNYTGVREEYLDYIVESYNFDNMIDFVMLTINIKPNGTGNEFTDMVDKMRNTRRFKL